MDAAVMPLPRPLITPPVTTMYLISYTPSGDLDFSAINSCHNMLIRSIIIGAPDTAAGDGMIIMMFGQLSQTPVRECRTARI